VASVILKIRVPNAGSVYHAPATGWVIEGIFTNEESLIPVDPKNPPGGWAYVKVPEALKGILPRVWLKDPVIVSPEPVPVTLGLELPPLLVIVTELE